MCVTAEIWKIVNWEVAIIPFDLNPGIYDEFFDIYFSVKEWRKIPKGQSNL